MRLCRICGKIIFLTGTNRHKIFAFHSAFLLSDCNKAEIQSLFIFFPHPYLQSYKMKYYFNKYWKLLRETKVLWYEHSYEYLETVCFILCCHHELVGTWRLNMSYTPVKQTESFRAVLQPLKSIADFSNSSGKKLNTTWNRREQCCKDKQYPFCSTNFAMRGTKKKSYRAEHGCYKITDHSSKKINAISLWLYLKQFHLIFSQNF